MGSDLLRPHGGQKNRLRTGELRSSPAKPDRSTNLARHTRTPRRQVDEASPGCRSPPILHEIDSSFTPGRSRRRSRIPESEGQLVVKMPVKNLVMEEVTILKRGEEARLDRREEDPQPSDRKRTVMEGGVAGDDLALCSTKRLGPEPEILPKQIRLVERRSPLYAGSGFFASPSPRSLPLPTAFFAKKEMANTTDMATRGLRYILRLDLP